MDAHLRIWVLCDTAVQDPAGVSDCGKAAIGIGVTSCARRAAKARDARAAASNAGLRGSPSASDAPGVGEVLLLRGRSDMSFSKTYNCLAERGRCTYVAEVLTTNYTVSIRIVTNADTTTEICSVSTRRRYNTVA